MGSSSEKQYVVMKTEEKSAAGKSAQKSNEHRDSDAQLLAIKVLGDLEANNSDGKIQTASAPLLESKGFWSKYAGILFSVNASLFFSLTAVVIKYLSEYHPFSISVWRHVAILVPTLPVVLAYQLGSNRKSDTSNKDQANETSIFSSLLPMSTREKRVLVIGLVLRGILGATALLLQVWSLKYLSVGDASIFTFSAPVFVVIFAYFCLGEKCGFVSLLVVLFTLCGVLVIVRPPILTGQGSYDMDNLKGASLGLASVLLNSMVIIILRRIREVHWALILLIFGILGVAENLIVAFAAGVFRFPVGLQDSLLTFVALPVTVYGAQMSLILALKLEDAGPVALVGTSGVVFSFLLQIVFFGVPPDIYSLLGATIVVLGVVVTTLRKWVSGLPEENPTRRRFRYILK